jgi:hypothetical protein
MADQAEQTLQEGGSLTDVCSLLYFQTAQANTSAALSSPPKVAYSHYPVSVTIKRKQLQMKAAAIIKEHMRSTIKEEHGSVNNVTVHPEQNVQNHDRMES